MKYPRVKTVFRFTSVGFAAFAIAFPMHGAAPHHGTLPIFLPPNTIKPHPDLRVDDNYLDHQIEGKTTEKVKQRLDDGGKECSELAKEYRPDCLRIVFGDSSRKVGQNKAYDEIRRELKLASQKIDTVVKANIDKSKPTITVNGKKIRAVKKSAVKKVNAQTKKIIKETETKLLRSAGNSADRKVAYTQIAQAVGSTKVLLRS